jgi:hypothetical protein
MGHFLGYFEGGLDFFDPLEISLEMARFVVYSQKKNNIPHFQNFKISGALIVKVSIMAVMMDQ